MLCLLHVDRSLVGDELAVAAVGDDAVSRAERAVFVASVRRESPFVRDHEELTARELELGSAESLEDVSLVLHLGAHRQENLADVDASDEAARLAKSMTHAGLQTISAGARKHLVNAEHVPRVHANAQVKVVLAAVLHNVLVARNASSFQRFARNVLLLLRHHVYSQREIIHMSLLATQIVDPDLGIGHTTAVARLDVRLVLDKSIAASWTATHLFFLFFFSIE
jgi:hypothetical protein